jgi:hypothetical protein
VSWGDVAMVLRREIEFELRSAAAGIEAGNANRGVGSRRLTRSVIGRVDYEGTATGEGRLWLQLGQASGS